MSVSVCLSARVSASIASRDKSSSPVSATCNDSARKKDIAYTYVAVMHRMY